MNDPMGLDEARAALLHWTPNGCTEALDVVFAELARLSSGDMTTEWGVRWIGGDVETSSEFTEDGMRSYIADMDAPAVLVRREKRVTAWTGVAT